MQITHRNYGLETVVSVLFSNTRTRLLYNEREIFNTARSVLKISSSLYSKQVRVFENKTLATVSNPFNIQFELTAGDRLTMASRSNIGSISAALSCLVYPPREESSGEERGLLPRTAAGNRA